MSDELGNIAKQSLPRCFGGVHVFFLGDFWQLNPTGQIAIMSNPYGEKALSSAKAPKKATRASPRGTFEHQKRPPRRPHTLTGSLETEVDTHGAELELRTYCGHAANMPQNIDKREE